MNRILIMSAIAIAATGCSAAPKVLRGEFATQGPQSSSANGQQIRWGGSIIEVEPKAAQTCFQILSRELGASARPREVDASNGRFLACRSGFYDPAVFGRGREVTVVGAVAGTEIRSVGEYALSMPLIAADVIYLWPERTLRDNYDDGWHFWPRFHYGWYGPGVHIHRVRRSPEPAQK